MTDPKKPQPTKQAAPIEDDEFEADKIITNMDIDEFSELVEKGDSVLPKKVAPGIDELYSQENLEKFLMGEITWGQLQGMTMEEAYAIAGFGYGLYQEGKFHDAQTIFEGLVLANPYDSYFHNVLGAVYQQLDKDEEAGQEYTLAIDLDKENLHAYVNRGELLLQNGDFDKALDDLQVAIELDPKGHDQASIRARALVEATANAIAALQKALKEQSKKDTKTQKKG